VECGSLPWDTPTGYQIATEITLTQIGIQATAIYQDDTDKLACTVASSVFTWVRLKAFNETTRIRQIADPSFRQRGRPVDTRQQISNSNIPTGNNIWSQVPQGYSIPRHIG
jgi:hypothetical protein